MGKIKENLRKIKGKYGVTAVIAGFLAVGGLQYDAIQNEKEQKTEQRKDKKEMTPEEQSDATLISVLIQLEGLNLNAYADDIGVWTYGIGCTKTIEGNPVKKGDVLKNNKEAFTVANYHIKERIDWVFDYIDRVLNPNQKAALKSFAYNCGADIFVQDGKLTKLGEAVNRGDDDFVIKNMLTYNKAGGSFMRGLFFRRVLEAYIYQGFVSLVDLQKCVIGGIGNVSCNKEMLDNFNVQCTYKRNKRGRKKVRGTFSDAAITDSSVAQKMIEICQTPIKGEVSQKYADFHTGEQVIAFLPKRYTITSVKQWPTQNFASIAYPFTSVIQKIKDRKDNSK